MSRSFFKDALKTAAREAVGGGVGATTGVLQGLTNTEHIRTGNPSVTGAVGAAAGRRARNFAINTAGPRYNPRARHQSQTLPVSAQQHARTRVIGTRAAIMGTQGSDGKEASLS
jgi:hypothetical protein